MNKLNFPKNHEIALILINKGKEPFIKHLKEHNYCSMCSGKGNCDIEDAANGKFDEMVAEYKKFKPDPIGYMLRTTLKYINEQIKAEEELEKAKLN